VIDSNDIISFLHNPLAYEQNLVSIINNKGEQIPLLSSSELYKDSEATIKVEGMERFNLSIHNRCDFYKSKYAHRGPVTCHLFMAKKHSPSFGMHTDPDDVIIYCVEGTKTLTVDGQYIVLNTGEEVYIPADTAHIAHNEYPAMTLSFGLEKFLIDKAKNYELDYLPKDNGDVQS
jgi:mannose-6-phosphate isomerase-like protein (cupin superfamily)